MSQYLFTCPQCAGDISTDDDLTGLLVSCPACEAAVTVPQPPPLDFSRPGQAPVTAAPPPAANAERQILLLRPSLAASAGTVATAIVAGLASIVAVAWISRSLSHEAGALATVPALIIWSWTAAATWYRTRSRLYRVTDQRLFVITGLVAKRTDEIELFRVKDVRVDQTFLQRILGYGSVLVLSADETSPSLTLAGVSRPIQVKETIRSLYRSSRRREGLRPAELITDA